MYHHISLYNKNVNIINYNEEIINGIRFVDKDVGKKCLNEDLNDDYVYHKSDNKIQVREFLEQVDEIVRHNDGLLEDIGVYGLNKNKYPGAIDSDIDIHDFDGVLDVNITSKGLELYGSRTPGDENHLNLRDFSDKLNELEPGIRNYMSEREALMGVKFRGRDVYDVVFVDAGIGSGSVFIVWK